MENMKITDRKLLISDNEKPLVSSPITDEKLPTYNKVTDEKLYELCKRYGSSALLWRRKFTGLLPEVDRRRLYERKGCSTIFEFAFKLCGLSTDQVSLALNLRRRFNNMPALKKMLENGEVSINKLARVVSIATPENEEELAEKVKILPVKALNTLVKDEKMEAKKLVFGHASSSQDGSRKPLFGDKGLYVQTFALAPDIIGQLNELHSKGIDINDLLRKLLKQRKEEIEKKKEEIVEEQSRKASAQIIKSTNNKPPNQAPPSRYIPAKVKEVLHQEHGTKCSIPTCNKPAEVIHHTQTFGLSHAHDPRFLAPLCKEHHAIAHSMDTKYHEIRQKACAS